MSATSPALALTATFYGAQIPTELTMNEGLQGTLYGLLVGSQLYGGLAVSTWDRLREDMVAIRNLNRFRQAFD